MPEVFINGTISAGSGGQHCVFESPPAGWIIIEPNLIQISGAYTTFTGGNLLIYGGKAWTLDLRAINRLIAMIPGDILLAVGTGGLIDLRDNTVPLLATSGKVMLFADEILLDEGVMLADLFTVTDPAQDIVITPAKVFSGATFLDPGKITGSAGETVAIDVTLVNMSPEPDTFTVDLVGPESGLLRALPGTVSLEPLAMKAFTVDLTLSDTVGSLEHLQVTATSETDLTVTAQLALPIAVVAGQTAENTIIHIESPPETKVTTFSHQIPLIPPCPTTPGSLIDDICNNHGHTLVDTTLTDRANLAGGTLAGFIHNDGVISQVTVAPAATLVGGKISGFVDNQGTLKDIEFVGAQITGGYLSGNIVNNTRIGGFFEDVSLTANTHITGGGLAGRIVGDPQDPALLEQLWIKSGSYLAHVSIGANVKFMGEVFLGEQVYFIK